MPGISNRDEGGGVSVTDSAVTCRMGSVGASSGSPNRISQARRAGSFAGVTSYRIGAHVVVSSHRCTRSPAKNGRHVPPSRRKGNSGAARANDISTWRA